MHSPRPLDALLAALPEYVLAPEGIALGVAVTAVEHDSRIVGPGSLYCALKLCTREIASRQRLFCIFHDRNEAKIDRLRQLLLNRSQAFDSARINRFRRTIAEKCVDDDFQAAQPVIEQQKRARNHEQCLGQLKFILFR